MTVVLWVMFPLTLYLAARRPPLRFLLAAMGTVALVADYIVIRGTFAEREHIALYLSVNGALGAALIAAWTALWLCWQLLIVRALVSAFRPWEDDHD